jgi:hypothetical protein
MASHTPGPWRVHPEIGFTLIEAPDGSEIADVRDEANAPLIAAAPILYRELSHLVRLMEPLERDGRLNVPGVATLNGARAALSSAKGKE